MGMLDVKERDVKIATDKEHQLHTAEIKATRRELQMQLLLGSHDRNLKLLNSQVELAIKEAERERAKGELSTAEKALLDAQAKLDKTVQTEENNNKNIIDTQEQLNKLLEEHRKAQEGYNKQDPAERKRSFSTSLAGSGPDPNGVDIR